MVDQPAILTMRGQLIRQITLAYLCVQIYVNFFVIVYIYVRNDVDFFVIVYIHVRNDVDFFGN